MKEDFIAYQAQTTPHPLAMEIKSAKGSYIYDTNNVAFLDFVAGVSACNLGHTHPKVVSAIKEQSEKYLHVMVYGEYIQEPSLRLCKLLAKHLPASLSNTYLTNSGTEAIEGALKLAKRYTGRSEIIAATNAYHGNTQGAMSVMGYEERKSAFRPLLPGVQFINFNKEEDLLKITSKTAAVLLETIQGGAGFICPTNHYLQKVAARCKQVGALLILDEIQPGFGRTGKLFGFEHYNVVPDILVIGKAMGGGMPVGGFVSSKEIMQSLSHTPTLGHITTFGGHPVIAAACLATLQEITQSSIMQEIAAKNALFKQELQHPLIKEVRGEGLMLAILVTSAEVANHVILESLQKQLILFWLLFEPRAVRITPPLTISLEEIKKGCRIIIETLEAYQNEIESKQLSLF